MADQSQRRLDRIARIEPHVYVARLRYPKDGPKVTDLD